MGEEATMVTTANPISPTTTTTTTLAPFFTMTDRIVTTTAKTTARTTTTTTVVVTPITTPEVTEGSVTVNPFEDPTIRKAFAAIKRHRNHQERIQQGISRHYQKIIRGFNVTQGGGQREEEKHGHGGGQREEEKHGHGVVTEKDRSLTTGRSEGYGLGESGRDLPASCQRWEGKPWVPRRCRVGRRRLAVTNPTPPTQGAKPILVSTRSIHVPTEDEQRMVETMRVRKVGNGKVGDGDSGQKEVVMVAGREVTEDEVILAKGEEKDAIRRKANVISFVDDTVLIYTLGGTIGLLVILLLVAVACFCRRRNYRVLDEERVPTPPPRSTLGPGVAMRNLASSVGGSRETVDTTMDESDGMSNVSLGDNGPAPKVVAKKSGLMARLKK